LRGIVELWLAEDAHDGIISAGVLWHDERGLVDLAHRKGLNAVRTRLLQVPSDDNLQTSICAAEAETERGTFSRIGVLECPRSSVPMGLAV
jgi:hypothetical protein